MKLHSMGQVPNVSAQYVVVLYDPSDGRVAHLHLVHVLEGGKDVTRAEAEEEAKAKAAAAGHDVAKHQLLHASELPEGDGLYLVDTAKGILVAAP